MSSKSMKIVLAVYGVPNSAGSDVLTKEAAEKIAAQMQGKIIDNPANPRSAKKLLVVSTSLEGDEKRGQVVVECAEAEDSVCISDA